LDLLLPFPNVQTSSHFQRIYYLSLYFDVVYVSEDTSSSNFSEETEREDIPDLNHCTSDINREEEEENWDFTDEVNDTFDPSCKSVCSSP
jgi:hypothetical protein